MFIIQCSGVKFSKLAWTQLKWTFPRFCELFECTLLILLYFGAAWNTLKHITQYSIHWIPMNDTAEASTHHQWRNVSKYIYSFIPLKKNFEVLWVFWVCYFKPPTLLFCHFWKDLLYAFRIFALISGIYIFVNIILLYLWRQIKKKLFSVCEGSHTVNTADLCSLSCLCSPWTM